MKLKMIKILVLLSSKGIAYLLCVLSFFNYYYVITMIGLIDAVVNQDHRLAGAGGAEVMFFAFVLAPSLSPILALITFFVTYWLRKRGKLLICGLIMLIQCILLAVVIFSIVDLIYFSYFEMPEIKPPDPVIIK